METRHLSSWEEFPGAISEIRNEFGSYSRELPDGGSYEVANDVLFRFQADSGWHLETTLERASDNEYSLSNYTSDATRYVNEIESVTGKKLEVPTWNELRESLKANNDFMRVYWPAPVYAYLVYLRHHGFPSPLLDWTKSPYIAAYFAFEKSIAAERCAIYAAIEMPRGGKSGWEGEAFLRAHGPYVTTHARHFNQKSWYTTATRWDKKSKEHVFCSHDHVKNGSRQDVIIKMTLPRTERLKVLRELEDYNINHYTLFQSEDALIRTMAMREFDLG